MISDVRVHPIFGAGIAGKSLVVTSQRRLNCYFENRDDKDKTPIACYGTPGLSPAFTIGTGLPVRGWIGNPTNLYAVAGGQFFALTATGTQLTATAIGTVVGNVSLAQNPTQILMVDGSKGYIYASGVLTAIASAGFPNGAKTATFVSGFFVCESPGTQTFFVSNSYDGTTWQGALASANASQYPDLLLAVDSFIGNLVLFSTIHTEFWQNTVASPQQPFSPILSATVEYGLAAIFSRAHVDNSLVFLAQSPQGGVQVCQIVGYQVTPISTPDLESILNGFSVVSDAVALVYRADKHAMYQLTFPTANRSFLFDALTRLWSETQSGLTSLYAQRHNGNFSTLAGSTQYVSDFTSNQIYTMSPTAFTDNGITIPRQIVTRHELNDHNVFSIDELYMDMETGVGLKSGQGSSPTIQVECSKNNGRTWLTPRTTKLQAQGIYSRMPPLRRWGSSRVFDFRISMTDPVKFVMTSAAESSRVREQ